MKFKFIFSFFLLIIYFLSTTSSLSVVTHVPEKYVTVSPGERFYFEIEVKYPENNRRKDLRLNYEIIDSKGNLIAQSKVLKAVETQASFIDFIIIPETAKNGIHFIKVKISDYKNLNEEVQASFTVKKDLDFQFYFFILLGFVILLSIILILFLIRKRK